MSFWHIPVLWSSSSTSEGQDTHLQNTAPLDISVDAGHYGHNLVILSEEQRR